MQLAIFIFDHSSIYFNFNYFISYYSGYHLTIIIFRPYVHGFYSFCRYHCGTSHHISIFVNTTSWESSFQKFVIIIINCHHRQRQLQLSASALSFSSPFSPITIIHEDWKYMKYIALLFSSLFCRQYWYRILIGFIGFTKKSVLRRKVFLKNVRLFIQW